MQQHTNSIEAFIYLATTVTAGAACNLSRIFNSSAAEMLSSGSDPGDETGLLIYSESSMKAQYQTTDAQCFTKNSPLSSTEWTRFTFMLKRNFDTRIFLDNVKVGSHGSPGETYLLNSEKVINLASRLSFFQWWSVQNIQLSDLSLWRDIPAGWDIWAGLTLPETLGNDLFLVDCNSGPIHIL